MANDCGACGQLPGPDGNTRHRTTCEYYDAEAERDDAQQAHDEEAELNRRRFLFLLEALESGAIDSLRQRATDEGLL